LHRATVGPPRGKTLNYLGAVRLVQHRV